MCPATTLSNCRWEPEGFAIIAQHEPIPSNNVPIQKILKGIRMRVSLARELDEINRRIMIERLGLNIDATREQIELVIIALGKLATGKENISYEEAYGLGTSKTIIAKERESATPIVRRRQGRRIIGLSEARVEDKKVLTGREPVISSSDNEKSSVVLLHHPSVIYDQGEGSLVAHDAIERIAEDLSISAGRDVIIG